MAFGFSDLGFSTFGFLDFGEEGEGSVEGT
jgi:hypothetical protein